MQGRESFVRDMVEMIISHPLDCAAALISSGESTYLFWVCFCSLVKSDITKKNEKLAGDIAVVQAALVIEICNNLFKSYALKERERETAFRGLEANMDKAPFYYTMDMIVKFTNNKGMPLLGQYSEKELEDYIRKKTTESEEDAVPEWIIINSRGDEKWFIKKGNMLPLVTRLMVDARPLMQKEVSSRWKYLVQSYKTEPAMENDAEFDKILTSYTGTVAHTLRTFLDDPKLFWVYDELERTQGMIPPASRIFHNGKLIPMSSLFALRRKEILTGIKLSLPFWYSLPVISSIIAFFAKFKKRKKTTQRANSRAVDIDFDESVSAQRTSAHEVILSSAQTIQATLVPQGKRLDEYLKEIENRWSKLLDRQAQKNLVEDINSLVRDHLRKALRVRKHGRITETELKELAEGIVKGTPSLESLKANDYLKLYMQLYMLKLLFTLRP
jgi:hypothetical protein